MAWEFKCRRDESPLVTLLAPMTVCLGWLLLPLIYEKSFFWRTSIPYLGKFLRLISLMNVFMFRVRYIRRWCKNFAQYWRCARRRGKCPEF